MSSEEIEHNLNIIKWFPRRVVSSMRLLVQLLRVPIRSEKRISHKEEVHARQIVELSVYSTMQMRLFSTLNW